MATKPPPIPSLANSSSETPASFKRVDFSDPVMRQAAMTAKGVSLCAYLMTLAAFQRGLRVTFHYELRSSTSCNRFDSVTVQGHRGELFSLSDGQKEYFFRRTMGDLTTPEVSLVVDDKHKTKRALKKAGVGIPSGIVVERNQIKLVENFLSRFPGGRFVVKPFRGSMGIDVHVDVPADQVVSVMEAIDKQRLVIEQFVSGTEYRVYVVGERYIAATRRIPANVIGDGTRTIRDLIALKNRARESNPRLHSRPIILTEAETYLAKQGTSLDHIPSEQTRVILSETANISRGGDSIDVTANLPLAAQKTAIAACKALDLPNGGVDLIVSDNPDLPGIYVIELNQCAHIGSHSFPMLGGGQGNAVAEAIIDYYFPKSVSNRRHSSALYDFGAVKRTLESQQIGAIALPVIGPEWQSHQIRFAAGKPEEVKAIRQLFLASGCHATFFNHPDSSVAATLLFHPSNFEVFLKSLPQGKLRENFSTLLVL